MLCQHWDSGLGQFQFTCEHAATGTSYRGLKNPPYIFLRFSWSFLTPGHILKTQIKASVWHHMGISGPPDCVGQAGEGQLSPNPSKGYETLSPAELSERLISYMHRAGLWKQLTGAASGTELSPVQGRLNLQRCFCNRLQIWPAAVSDAKPWLCSSSTDSCWAEQRPRSPLGISSQFSSNFMEIRTLKSSAGSFKIPRQVPVEETSELGLWCPPSLRRTGAHTQEGVLDCPCHGTAAASLFLYSWQAKQPKRDEEETSRSVLEEIVEILQSSFSGFWIN